MVGNLQALQNRGAVGAIFKGRKKYFQRYEMSSSLSNSGRQSRQKDQEFHL